MATSADLIRTFDQLSEPQRAVAWGVVRSIATALWTGLFAAFISWFLLTARAGASLLEGSAPALLVGAAAVAGVMELKARDLEKLDPVEDAG